MNRPAIIIQRRKLDPGWQLAIVYMFSRCPLRSPAWLANSRAELLAMLEESL